MPSIIIQCFPEHYFDKHTSNLCHQYWSTHSVMEVPSCSNMTTSDNNNNSRKDLIDVLKLELLLSITAFV